MNGSYRDILCCNNNRNIDSALTKYEKERDHIIKTLSRNHAELVNKIWTDDGFLSNDSRCMCHAGKHKKYTAYTCPPCVNLGRLIDYDEDKIGKPFLIECGDKVGSSFILISFPVGTTSLVIDESDKTRAQNFLQEHKDMLKCGSQELSELTFVKNDIFTNNILVWWIVDKIFQRKGLPYTLPLHTAFICRQKGFLLSNSPTIGNFKQLQAKSINNNWDKRDVCNSICKQLGVILDILHSHYFSHGNPHSDMLLFSDDPIEHDYDNITVSSDFTMHLVDFTYSSITNENIRLYPKTESSNVLFNHCIINIDIKDGMYYLSNKSDVLFNYIRHAGLPIYSSSFDFYCFIISLMLDDYFYYTIKEDSIMNKAWESIWYDTDLSIIETRIKKMKKKDNPDIARMLGGLWLQCDVVKTWLTNL